MPNLVKYAFLVAIVALLSACDSESKFKDLAQAIERNKLNISSVVVEPTLTKTIAIGGTPCDPEPCDTTYLSTSQTETFIAYGLTPDNQRINISDRVVWSTSNTSIAQVAPNGAVTTQMTLGAVDVIASFASIQGRAPMMVSSAMLADDTFIFRNNQGAVITSPQQITMCDTFEMQVVGDFGDSNRIITHDISWSTRLASAPTEVTLDGKVVTNQSIFAVFSSHTPETYAVNAGYQNDPNSTVSSIINFNVVTDNFGTSISVTPPSQTVTKDTTFQFSASTTSIDGVSKDITNTAKWESSNLVTATVKDGLVTAKDVGTTSLTASCGTIASPLAPVTVVLIPTLVAIDIQGTDEVTISVLNLDLLSTDNKEKDLIVVASYTNQSESDITADLDISNVTITAIDGNNVTPPISVVLTDDDRLRVTAKRLGVASLTVKYSGREDAITVNVR